MPAPLERILTGAAAWFLADCRHSAATRVQVDVLGRGRLRISSDGEITGRPTSPHASLEALLTQRGWGFQDGRLDWPEILDALAEWKLVLPRPKGSLVVTGSHSLILDRAASSRVEPGARFTFVPDTSRTLGSLSSPEVLAALHAQAAKWPDAKYSLKLPGADRWLAQSQG